MTGEADERNCPACGEEGIVDPDILGNPLKCPNDDCATGGFGPPIPGSMMEHVDKTNKAMHASKSGRSERQRLCPECDQEVVESDSERGDYWCLNCGTSRSSRDVVYSWDRCKCCTLDSTADEELRYGFCQGCIDAGCDETFGNPGCLYRQSITEPSECDDHSFIPRGTKIKCRWCGYVTAGGPSTSDYGENWDERRFEILERDGFECRLCGISQSEHREKEDVGLHVHHIQPFRTFDDPEVANQASNLVTVCSDCHTTIEPLSEEEQRRRLSTEGVA